MRISFSQLSFRLGVIVTSIAFALAISPSIVSAQSSGSSCNPPSFQITSSKNISAIAGESFTYFVVTENNTSYRLQSQMPSGLSFSNNQISGTPQTAGDYTLQFVSTDGCDTTQTVNLSVIGSGSSQQSAQDNSDASGGSDAGDQLAQSQGSVGLNEIPDTGFSADTALTLSFYALALIMLSYGAVRRLSPETAPSNNVVTQSHTGSDKNLESADNQAASQAHNQVGDGIM